jgi:hypothetical protein
MKPSVRPRKTAELSQSIHHQLNTYALAATAAGVGVLALAQPAGARIVYTPANQTINPKTQYQLDLNHDGITDFTLSNFYTFLSTHSLGGRISIDMPSGNEVMAPHRGAKVGAYMASALPAGIKIQANKKFKAKLKSAELAGSWRSEISTGNTGNWLNVQNRYLGLRFVITGKIHYGWARLNVSCAKYQCTALLTGYAYETVANKAIIAGKTKGPDDALQPATLGHLAQGASGLPAWRGTDPAAPGH